MTSCFTTQSKPFSGGDEVTVNDYGNHRPAKVIERRTTRPSRGGFSYLVEFTDTDLIERASFDGAMVLEREPAPDRREQMRAQIQSIAYDGVLMLREDGSPRMPMADYGKAAAAKLERIANIAEAGEPDEDWETITGEVDAPRRDEDNQAMLDSLSAPTMAERAEEATRQEDGEPYIVVGVFRDEVLGDGTLRRFADEYMATEGWEQAEAKAKDEYPTLEVGGVLKPEGGTVRVCGEVG